MICCMRQPVPALLVSPGQREVLESVARSSSAPHREVVRARALMMAADGLANTAIARALSVSTASVSGWRTRFAEEGLGQFAHVRPGRGRKTTIPQEKIDENRGFDIELPSGRRNPLVVSDDGRGQRGIEMHRAARGVGEGDATT